MLDTQNTKSTINPVAEDHLTVPLLNLPGLYQKNKSEYDSAIAGILSKAAFIGGQAVNQFENKFSNWILPGSHCVGSANGTDALTVAALSLGLPRGSRAILPAMTYVATLEAVIHAGFEPELVDVESGTWHIDTEQLSKKLTSNTDLIVPVHLYGQMAEMDKISAIAKQRGNRILEDSAQSHGATWKGKAVAYWGDIAGYSFYPGKNLGAFGDGGAILSTQKDLIDSCRAISNHGGVEKYVHNRIGFNSRLDGIQAAILDVKMKYIDAWNESRRQVASIYLEELSDISELELPVVRKDAKHVFHLFVVLVENRTKLMDFLKTRGIETGIHYPKAIHQHEAVKKYAFSQKRFPNAEHLAAFGMSLPMCPLMSEAQTLHVVKSVRKYFGK